MSKAEYIKAVELALAKAPKNDREKILDYCMEMIDDRMEEGMTEEDAIADMGLPQMMAEQLLAETMSKEEKQPRRKLRVWEIVLLILGSPIWLSMLLSLFAVLLSCFLMLWVMVAVCYILVLSLAVVFLAGLVGSVLFWVQGQAAQGFVLLGSGLICGGIAVFLLLGSNYFTLGACKLSKWSFVQLLHPFGKEQKQ